MKKTIITVGGQKGGISKTTIAVSLATMRKRQGRDVLLIDADEQKNAIKWAMRRNEIPCIDVRVPVVAIYGKGLANEVRDLANRYDDIVIDVAGHKSPEFLSALTCSNKLISPIRTSQFDMDTMIEVDQLVELMSAANRELIAQWFISMASANPASRQASIIETREMLLDLKNLAPMESFISTRTGFELIGRGLTIEETPRTTSRDKGIQEIKQLYAEAWQW